jgi:putative salt-induced outer membrane protein YdiY
MHKIGRLWRHHKLACTGFVIATILTLFFSARAIMFVIYWNDPAHVNQPLERWMTLGYIARSYDVSREDLAAELQVSPAIGRPANLDRLARELNMPLTQLEALILRTVSELQAGGDAR